MREKFDIVIAIWDEEAESDIHDFLKYLCELYGFHESELERGLGLIIKDKDGSMSYGRTVRAGLDGEDEEKYFFHISLEIVNNKTWYQIMFRMPLDKRDLEAIAQITEKAKTKPNYLIAPDSYPEPGSRMEIKRLVDGKLKPVGKVDLRYRQIRLFENDKVFPRLLGEGLLNVFFYERFRIKRTIPVMKK